MGQLENRRKGLEEALQPKKESRIEGSRKMQNSLPDNNVEWMNDQVESYLLQLHLRQNDFALDWDQGQTRGQLVDTILSS